MVFKKVLVANFQNTEIQDGANIDQLLPMVQKLCILVECYQKMLR